MAQGIEASDEDVDARLNEMAESRGMPPAELRKIAKEQGWSVGGKIGWQHQEYRQARQEFRRCLETELAANGVRQSDDWEEFLSLLS